MVIKKFRDLNKSEFEKFKTQGTVLELEDDVSIVCLGKIFLCEDGKFYEIEKE